MTVAIVHTTAATGVNDATKQISKDAWNEAHTLTGVDLTALAALSGTNTGDQTNITGNAATVTTNANLTGVITSVGNATSIASQTGIGTKFVMDTSPTLVTPLLGTPTSGVLTNCTGTASGLTAGTVTTNANLTGDVTSVGNATTIGATKVTNAMLAGSIAASKLTGTDIATVGTLIAGATGAGFTLALGSSTITGALGETHGGTNQTTYTKGDILVSSAANTLAKFGVGTDSFMLSADSNAANGIAYYGPGLGLPGYISGRYYGPWLPAAASTRSITANSVRACPVYVSKRTTFTGIGFWLTANASAANMKFGVYSTNATGQPGSLVANTSVTVSNPISTAVTVDAAFSSAQTLNPGWYWLACLSDQTVTAAAVGPSAQLNNIVGAGLLSASSMGAELSVAQTYATGLPNPFGTVVYAEATATPLMALKAQ